MDKSGGFDNILFSANGKVNSVLAREAFINLLHPIQPFKFGIKTINAKMALKYNVKLIMFGEPYVEYGSDNTKSSGTKPAYNIDWYINDSDDIFLAAFIIEIC